MSSHNPEASASQRIRHHLEQVAHLRKQARSQGLASAVQAVKQLQARRFRGSYRDLLNEQRHAEATRFFLEELYGAHDFAQRDAQFARIAGAIERLFPAAVAQLAGDLAETHALTETLDHQMALRWMEQPASTPPAPRYVHSWRSTGQRDSRHRQLAVVQHMGVELQRLTQMKRLRLGLKMMRGPANAAGLGLLQQFLESGFQAFATMGDATHFLHTIAQRETHWIQTLFDAEPVHCAQALERELLQA